MKDEKVFGEAEVALVAIETPEGEVLYYTEDIIIPYDGKEFAILVPTDEDEEMILARLEENADGEIEYVSPDDDEFAAVEKIYLEMPDEE